MTKFKEYWKTDFRTIIEALPYGIVLIDSVGTIILVNKTIEHLFDYEAVELLNQPISRLLPEIFNSMTPVQTQNFYKGNMQYSLDKMNELKAKRKNDTTFPAEINISPIHDMEGLVVLITVVDTTQRKAVEEKNFRQMQKLKQRHDELNLLNLFGSSMQACKKTSETVTLVAKYASQLFPNCGGGLYLVVSDNNLLQAATSFNNPLFNLQILTAEDCWALRTCRLHKVDDPTKDVICIHNSNLNKPCPHYFCVPLFSQGETLGLFYLEAANHDSLADQEVLVKTFSEQIALGLSNVKLQETLREQSIRDVLTGLYNRRYLEEAFRRELIRLKRNPSKLTIILFDIDHFKNFNDTYGHKAGDYLLKALGSLVTEKMRASDIICRYGGEEFLIILPETSIGTGWQRAEQLRMAVTEMRVNYDNKPLHLTVSLGVAAYPENGTEMTHLFSAADLALYRAKKKGGDITVISD